MQHEKLEPGQLIFREGQEGHHAYRILSGRVLIFLEKEGGELPLAELSPGEIFGEMAIMQDRPRSASARALETTEVEVLTDYAFNHLILTEPKKLLPYLASFFERLRHANEQLARLARLSPAAAPIRPAAPAGQTPRARIQTAAERTAGEPGTLVPKFPFRIGRASQGGYFNVLFPNDYTIQDSEPYQVSPHQCSIESHGGVVVLRDRGSRHGTIVNGKAIGSEFDHSDTDLHIGDNEIILGKKDSPHRLWVSVWQE
ncbi:MAG TPA: cyclic nucleotide-binding domain-containing protein [Verrucomicrobiae bacterium]|nr:cyclic nucleotide-binding domain-containing protein [Verrucomicrobiae bacterium]